MFLCRQIIAGICSTWQLANILEDTCLTIAIICPYQDLLHKVNPCKVSITNCSSGSNATYSSTECSLTTPVEIVKALIAGRNPLVSLPMNVGFICNVKPRRSRTVRYVCRRGSLGSSSYPLECVLKLTFAYPPKRRAACSKASCMACLYCLRTSDGSKL